MHQVDVWRMIRRRAEAAGIKAAIGRHRSKRLGVEGPLHDLQKRYPDARIASKIEDIIAALAIAPAPAPRAP